MGFPIRTPSDHSSVDNSPRTIAASHVLHRLLMPRHPPCALKHFTTTRCSHPLCNTQHTTTPQPHRPPPHPYECVRQPRPGVALPENNTTQVSPQDPTVCRTSSSQSLAMIRVPPSRIPSAPHQQPVRDPEDAESEIRTTTTLMTHE